MLESLLFTNIGNIPNIKNYKESSNFYNMEIYNERLTSIDDVIGNIDNSLYKKANIFIDGLTYKNIKTLRNNAIADFFIKQPELKDKVLEIIYNIKNKYNIDDFYLENIDDDLFINAIIKDNTDSIKLSKGVDDWFINNFYRDYSNIVLNFEKKYV